MRDYERSCEIMRDHARSCKIMRDHARSCEIMQDHVRSLAFKSVKYPFIYFGLRNMLIQLIFVISWLTRSSRICIFIKFVYFVIKHHVADITLTHLR
jgi:hypothetical protein